MENKTEESLQRQTVCIQNEIVFIFIFMQRRDCVKFLFRNVALAARQKLISWVGEKKSQIPKVFLRQNLHLITEQMCHEEREQQSITITEEREHTEGMYQTKAPSKAHLAFHFSVQVKICLLQSIHYGKLVCIYHIFLMLLSFFFFFKDNCFTVLWQFLLYNNMNQL